MNSRRRSQDPKEKREGKKEQTGISYFDWRNAKRKSKGKEKIRVTRKETAMPQSHVKVLTVAARMSWGQHAKRKDLHTFGSLYFVPADSPEKIQVSQIFLDFNGLISNKVQPLKVVLYRIEHFHN